MANTLFLIPTVLAPDTQAVISEDVRQTTYSLHHFIVENERTARRYLRSIGFKKDFDSEVQLYVLDKRTKMHDVQKMFASFPKDVNVGLMSEAGCPGIADPGSMAVSEAHQRNWKVSPLAGPSSILLALIASGFNGQHFCFHGYLPIDREKQASAIKRLEGQSRKFKRTEIFMETPFRNDKLLNNLLHNLHDQTSLCVACEISAPDEWIHSSTVGEWKKLEKPSLHKRPAIFLLYSSL